MRAAKAWYLLYFSALSCLFPYLNLFFRRLGLSEQAIGMLGAARPFISLPAGSLWSGVADKSRRHRAVLLLTLCASVAARLSLAGAARLGFGPLLAAVAATELFAAPVTIIVDAAVMAACAQQGDYGRQRLWGAVGWGICAAAAGTAIARAGIGAAFAGHGLLAALALLPTLRLPFEPLHAKLAQQAGGGERHAADGDAAAAAAAAAAGEGVAAAGLEAKAAAAGSKGPVQRFDSALERESLLGGGGSPADGNPPATVSAAAGACGPPASPPSQQPGGAPPPPRVHYWVGVRRLLGSPEAAIFMAMAVTMGYGVGNVEGYIFLYLDELGGSELLMGLSLTVTCVAETAVFFFLPHIMRRLGIQRCLHLVFAAFLVRMGLYASLRYMPSPWMVLPAELLHGITFAVAWGVGSAYCEQLAPPGLEATTQGLFQGLYFGLGVGIGSLCGGYVYQWRGAQAVYLSACCVVAAGWALCGLAQLAVGWLGGRDRYLLVAASDVEMNQVTK